MDTIAFASVFTAMLMLDFFMGEYRKPRLFSMNEMGINILSIVIAFSIRALPFAVIMWLLVQFAQPIKGILSGVPFWWMFAVVALVDDYGNYWVHRLAHKVPWMWQLHKPHHVPEHLNVTMAIRENAFYYLILPVNLLAPLLAWVAAAEAAIAHTILKVTVVYLQHASWRWDLWMRQFAAGRLVLDLAEKLFSLQDFHHAHHGIGRYGNASSNFGNIFNVFDKLHGTSSDHPHCRQDAYGLPVGVRTESWAVQLFWPLLRESPQVAAGGERLEQSTPEALAAAGAVIVTADGLSIAVARP